jgi:hypothetical protein
VLKALNQKYIKKMKSYQTNIKTYKEEYDRYIQKIYENFGILYHQEHFDKVAVWKKGLNYSFELSALSQEEINQQNKQTAIEYLHTNLMIFDKWNKKYNS